MGGRDLKEGETTRRMERTPGGWRELQEDGDNSRRTENTPGGGRVLQEEGDNSRGEIIPGGGR